MQTEFPTAQILSNNSPPDTSILSAPEQYIQISNIRPMGDAQALKTAMVPVPERIARFYEVRIIVEQYNKKKKLFSKLPKTLKKTVFISTFNFIQLKNFNL